MFDSLAVPSFLPTWGLNFKAIIRNLVGWLASLGRKNDTKSSYDRHPTDLLLADYSTTKKDYFLEQLDSFIQSTEKALHEKTSQSDACKA